MDLQGLPEQNANLQLSQMKPVITTTRLAPSDYFQFSSETFKMYKTSREWHKSAPYPRLKIAIGLQSVKYSLYSTPEV